MPTKSQLLLLRAIKQRDLQAARSLLKRGVDPDFSDNKGTTPLHEAVRIRNLSMVKQLVKLGADVNRDNQYGESPLDLARRLRETDIAFFFQQNRAKRKTTDVNDDDFADDAAPVAAESAEPPKFEFTRQNLKDVFNPESWVGKTEEMEKLWQEVPKALKKHFDFAAALSEARRDTLRQNVTAKKLPPPPSN